MNRSDKTDYIINFYKEILENGFTDSNICKFIEIINNDDYINDDIDSFYVLNLINYARMTVLNCPSLFVKIEETKLKILYKTLKNIEDINCDNDCINCDKENIENTFDDALFNENKYEHDIVPEDNDEIYFIKNKKGYIYRKYIPKDNNFELPSEGSMGSLYINDFNFDGNEFGARVEIDSEGNVTKIFGSIIVIDDNQDESIDTIYTELLADVLKFKDEQ